MFANRYDSSEDMTGCIWLFIGAMVLFFTSVWWNSAVWVTDEAALIRFHELLPDADSVEIITDSGNDNVLVHEIANVQFELRVTEDGESHRISGTCTDGIFRDLVCRVYDTEE